MRASSSSSEIARARISCSFRLLKLRMRKALVEIGWFAPLAGRARLLPSRDRQGAGAYTLPDGRGSAGASPPRTEGLLDTFSRRRDAAASPWRYRATADPGTLSS